MELTELNYNPLSISPLSLGASPCPTEVKAIDKEQERD